MACSGDDGNSVVVDRGGDHRYRSGCVRGVVVDTRDHRLRDRALPAVGAVQSVDLGLFRVVGYSCSGGAGVAVLDSGRGAAALGRLGCCGLAANDVGGGFLFGVHVVVAGVAVGRG